MREEDKQKLDGGIFGDNIVFHRDGLLGMDAGDGIFMGRGYIVPSTRQGDAFRNTERPMAVAEGIEDQMNNLKLVPDLIPETSFFRNLRSELSNLSRFVGLAMR